jgi:hypothetical protein
MEAVTLPIVAGVIDAPIQPTLGGRIALVTLHQDGLRRFPRRERVLHADQVTVGAAVQWFETNFPGANHYNTPRWDGFVTAVDANSVTVQRHRNDLEALAAHRAWTVANTPPPKNWWEDDEAAGEPAA